VLTLDDFGCCTYELLEGLIKGFFVQGMHGAITSLKKTQYTKAPGDQLRAIEFTFQRDALVGKGSQIGALVGKGMIVGDGIRAYMVFAYSNGPHDRRAAVERFLQSFRLKSSSADRRFERPRCQRRRSTGKRRPQRTLGAGVLLPANCLINCSELTY
jgi:hypothetical protein